MKIKVKHSNVQPTGLERNQGVFKRLRSLTAFKREFSTPVPANVRTSTIELALPQDRLAALEAERRQTVGLSYVNMLPPR